MGDAVLQGLDLCIDANLSCRKSGNAHLHFDELYPTLFLGLGGYLFNLADRGFGKVGDPQISHQPVDYFFLNWSFH